MSYILLVEDDPQGIESIIYALSSKGFHVRLAVLADRALLAVRKNCPSLILLDLKLAGLSLPELLRQETRDNKLPIAGLAQNDDSHRQRAGYDAFIYKPIQAQKLIDTVVRLLKCKEPARVAPRWFYPIARRSR